MSDDATRSIERSVRGADRAFRVIDGGGSASTPPPDDGAPTCPVRPLGHLAGVFHFLDVRGQKRELTARQLGSRHELLSLFGGDDAWLRQAHPRRVNVNARSPNLDAEWKVVDFAVNDAAASLQRACFVAGLFGEQIVLRRPGIWRGEDGAPVVHCGDRVLIGAEWEDAGKRTGNQIWAAAAAIPRPDAPCAASVARDLLDGLTRWWRWREPGGPVAVLGLLANAYYGAATEWRPAGFVTGETGSGKSALQRVIRGALPLHHYDNDTRKAGIEQAVAGRAMPILIDEAADRADRDAARSLVDLVLSAAGDEGTKGSRGTADGRGRRIELVGLIIMFSINPPDLEPQHLGRFTMIDLRAPEDGDDHRVQHAELASFARRHGAQLWGRALAGWDRYVGALERFRAGLKAAGCAPREMDQAGALLAGWWVLAHEGLPDDRRVREGIGALEGYVRVAAAVAADSRPRRMLQHLLSSLVALHRSTDREPLGKLVEIAFGEGDPIRSPDDARELLTYYGIRVVRRCVNGGAPMQVGQCECANCVEGSGRGRPVPRMSPDAGLWFLNNHPELRKLFDKTPFDGERWRTEMLRLDSARPSGRTVRVGKVPGHAVWLPRRELEPPDDAENAL